VNKNMLLLVAAGVAAWYFLIYKKQAAPVAAYGTTNVYEAPKAANPWVESGIKVAGSLFANLLSGGNS